MGGGWVCEIKNKAELSPAEAGVLAELGNKIWPFLFLLLHHFEVVVLWSERQGKNNSMKLMALIAKA